MMMAKTYALLSLLLQCSIVRLTIIRYTTQIISLQSSTSSLFTSALVIHTPPSIPPSLSSSVYVSSSSLDVSTTFIPSSLDHSSLLLSTATTPTLSSFPSMSKATTADEVVRILDSNTIKLQNNGLITLSSARGFKEGSSTIPECTTKSSTYMIRKMLPAGTKVHVLITEDSAADQKKATKKALVIRDKDDALINVELVRLGFARPSPLSKLEQQLVTEKEEFKSIMLDMNEKIKSAHLEAQTKHVGMYTTCENEQRERSIAQDDQFEPMEYTIQTKWSSDGGEPFLVQQSSNKPIVPPKNPGDVKGCSDFQTYEESLSYYEYYYPYYGDVAKLDRNEDGIPCPGLPHTKNMDRFRRKVPSSVLSQ